MPDKTTPHIEKAARAICEVDCGRVTPNELARCEGLAKAAFLTTLEPSEAEIEAVYDTLIGSLGSGDVIKGGPNWVYWHDIARACLIAAARARVGE